MIGSLINISRTNSPFDIKNLEPVKDGKRTLNEQFDNYIIIQFKKDVTFEGGNIFYLNHIIDYNRYITYIINGNQKIDQNTKFTVKNSTKLYIHFNQSFNDLTEFFNGNTDENLKNLISADFCHFDTSSVTTMFGMFNGCTSLRTLYLSIFNTSSVTSMAYIFEKYSSLRSSDLSNFDTSSLTRMRGMFYECSSLRYLIISNFNFDKIIKTNKDDGIEEIFKSIYLLEYIDIYNIIDTRNILKNAVE